jgi:hypothetical protein
VNITLEFDAGDGLGFQDVGDGTTADSVNLEIGSVGWIQEETCSTTGTINGKCSVTITSDQPGDSILVIEFNTEHTQAKFKFVTRWWAGTADIHKTFETTPFSIDTPSASFTLEELDELGNVIDEISTQVCSDGSNGCFFEWLDLPGGYYRLKESAVNNSHAIMDPIDFVIDAAHPDFHGPTVENPLLLGELQINKQFPNGIPWNGPKLNFEIYRCDDFGFCSDPDVLAKVATIEKGESSTTFDLHEGWYLVREIVADGISPYDGVGEQQILVIAGGQESLMFINNAQGCTPGFWQGGTGSQLWDEELDEDWVISGGEESNPYIHTTLFNDKFAKYSALNGLDMFDLVITGGGSDDWQKAARNVVASYLNASWGMAFPYTTTEVSAFWEDAVDGEEGLTFLDVHLLLGAANSQPNTCPIP